MNTTNVIFDFVICLPLYASSILWKKYTKLHADVLGFVMSWLCLMFDTVFCITKTKYTTVDALGLCYKSVFLLDNILYLWTLALPVWLLYWLSGSVNWCELKSPLLFCFLFKTQALVCIILVCWMYDYKCIVQNYILVQWTNGQVIVLVLISVSSFCTFTPHSYWRISGQSIIIRM